MGFSGAALWTAGGLSAGGLGAASSLSQKLWAAPAPQRSPLGFHFTDVTSQAGIHFRHNSGAQGKKYLPETMGAGCAFLDYDGDGWLDIILINGTSLLPRNAHGSAQPPITTLALYRNNRDGTFTDVTRHARLNVPMYGLGVAVGDYNNDGFPDIYVTCVGQNRLFRNTGKGTFVDETLPSGLGKRQSFSTSALWFDYDRDGLLDLFVCNYVKWSPEHDVFCSLDGKHKSYCTPEAYHGETCWLFHNRGNGTFEDVTATSGIFNSNSKSLGVAMLDYDSDGWPDLLVADDTQPNKLYKNQHNGKFLDVAMEAGIALSTEGKARAGMGVDAADFNNSGQTGVAITNFDNEMIGLYLPDHGEYSDIATQAGVGLPSRDKLGFGCLFTDVNLDGALDLVVVNGHIDDTVRNVRNVGYAQPPQLFLNNGHGKFHEVGAQTGGGFSAPKVGRGLAHGDFDRDGDNDLLMTTNHGPAYLYRTDQTSGNRSIRFHLQGTKSNRDAIGAVVRVSANGVTQSQMVKGGSSYLSQSELALTFGLGKLEKIDRVEIIWPSGRSEEFKGLSAGHGYQCIETKGISQMDRY